MKRPSSGPEIVARSGEPTLPAYADLFPDAKLVASAQPDLLVEGGRGIRIQADRPLDACLSESYDLVILPGGPGVKAERLYWLIVPRLIGIGKTSPRCVV